MESRTTNVIDPWGGSYFVERLTHDLAAKALEHIKEVEGSGGMTKAIEQGLPKMRIEEAAAHTQARIDSGKQTVVGVNKFRLDQEDDVDVLKLITALSANLRLSICKNSKMSAIMKLLHNLWKP